MKKIIFIILIGALNTISAQQIFPLDESKLDPPNGAYYKDLNNELNPYVGLWAGNWDGKMLSLEIRKIKKRYTSNDGSYFDLDKLVGERKVVSASGVIEVDRITTFDQDAPEFYGLFGQYKNFSQKYLLFQPKDMCGKGANVDITFTNPQKTEMSLHFKYNPNGIDESCQYYTSVMIRGKDWPFNFPKDIVLTKQ